MSDPDPNLPPELAAELRHVTDRGLTLLTRGCELALQAYAMLGPGGLGDYFVLAEQCQTMLAIARRERDRRDNERAG